MSERKSEKKNVDLNKAAAEIRSICLSQGSANTQGNRILALFRFFLVDSLLFQMDVRLRHNWKLRAIGRISLQHHQQQWKQLQLPSSALDYCQRQLLLFPSVFDTFGWQSFHTTGSLWSEVTVKVPAFAESISEGDVK